MKKTGYIKPEQHAERREHFLKFQQDLQEHTRTLEPLKPFFNQVNDKVSEWDIDDVYSIILSCASKEELCRHEDTRSYYARVLGLDSTPADCLAVERKEALADLVSYILYDWGPYDYRIIIPSSPDSTVEKT